MTQDEKDEAARIERLEGRRATSAAGYTIPGGVGRLTEMQQRLERPATAYRARSETPGSAGTAAV